MRVAIGLAVRDVAVDLDAALSEEVMRRREVRQRAQHPVGEVVAIAPKGVVVVIAVGPIARRHEIAIESIGAAGEIVDHDADLVLGDQQVEVPFSLVGLVAVRCRWFDRHVGLLPPIGAPTSMAIIRIGVSPRLCHLCQLPRCTTQSPGPNRTEP